MVVWTSLGNYGFVRVYYDDIFVRNIDWLQQVVARRPVWFLIRTLGLRNIKNQERTLNLGLQITTFQSTKYFKNSQTMSVPNILIFLGTRLFRNDTL